MSEGIKDVYYWLKEKNLEEAEEFLESMKFTFRERYLEIKEEETNADRKTQGENMGN